jgi:Uma2 family endonuclease
MDAPQSSPKVSWTDYQSWDDDTRWEIIDGRAYAMSAPRVSHQMVLGELYALLHAHFRGRRCRVFLSPIDVRLSEHDVVQPDLIVVCDRTQITDTHIEGPPELVVEILSPSTQRHDRVRKLYLYARFGVKEYWIFQPHPALAEVLLLDGASYRIAGAYTDSDRLVSLLFPELTLSLDEVFLPNGEDPVEEIREGSPPYARAKAI